MQDAIQRLQAERRKTLRQLIEIKRQTLQAQRGNSQISGIDQITRELDVLTLERQAAESKGERIAVLEKMVRQARQLEDAAKAEVQQGTGSLGGIQEAHIRTLEYQITLEEEKARP